MINKTPSPSDLTHGTVVWIEGVEGTTYNYCGVGIIRAICVKRFFGVGVPVGFFGEDNYCWCLISDIKKVIKK
jgi:hypothetical protein